MGVDDHQQFAVIGLGRFGRSIAQTLCSLGHQVLGVDLREEMVQLVADCLTHAVQADATDERVWQELGLRNFDVVVVAIGENIQASILATMEAKDAGVPRVVAKAQNELHGRVLERVGADQVVYPERDMASRLARSLVSEHFVDYIELSPDYGLVELKSPRAFAGKSLSAIDLRSRHQVTVLATKMGEEIRISPGGQDTIRPGEILVLIGPRRELDRLEAMD